MLLRKGQTRRGNQCCGWQTQCRLVNKSECIALPLPELLQHIVCHLRPPLPAHLLQQGPVGQNVWFSSMSNTTSTVASSRRSSDRLQITAMYLVAVGTSAFNLFSIHPFWQSPCTIKRRADSTPHSTPPPPAGKLEVEEPLYEKRAVYNNVLGEPEPLGLRLRKTPSIQMMLSQSKAGKNLCVTSSKGSKVGVKSNFLASSSSLSKIKASLFHASLLRVGTWKNFSAHPFPPICVYWLSLWRSSLCSIGKQFVTRYEGDLVAKCYFAKCKLLWEFLESGLKSKIEFHWSDITAIKAVFFDGGHGALDIVLARPPLFFREIDPQPRKHIQWQATQDFTNGQAHIHRGHILQCPQTSLSKNFEKLINCDPHLKLFSQQPDIILESPYFDPLLNQQPDIILESPYFAPLLSQQPDIILESPYFDPLLSQQPDIILESPYFDPQYSDIILASPYIDPQYSVLEGQSDFKSHIYDVIKDDSRTTFSDFYEPSLPCATSSISNKTETQDSFWRTLAFDSEYTPSPCSGNNISSNCITFQ
ncbi:hypothetical protein ZIOFF_052808 [Zingiber officinale]|uniref:TRF2/HOY1 PH-like domain-containing protein n=1 Tax=Zingiber officinale TaxID=94328 RepID=A0A8J5FKT7_ZINOF|nr:hypothetical protein ZIOFF_052808 [Zingiber officinale]